MKAGLFILVLLILMAGGWFAYSHYHHEKIVTTSVAATSLATENSDTAIAGSVEILQGNGFRMTLSNGDSKNIVLTATTTILQFNGTSTIPVPSTFDQISVGEPVAVIGTTNTDGSITASRIRAGTAPIEPVTRPTPH